MRRDKRDLLALLALVLLLVLSPAAAQSDKAAPEVASPPRPKPPIPRVHVLDLAGHSFTGQLTKADLADAVQLVCDGRPVSIPAADVIWLGIEDQPDTSARSEPWFAEEPLPGKAASSPPPQIKVLLRDGQVLICSVSEQFADTLVLEHRLLGRVVLPFSQVAQVDLDASPTEESSRDTSSRQPAGMLDQVDLANGDHLEAIVRGIGPRQVVVESPQGDRSKLDRDAVLAVYFAKVPVAAGSSQAAQSQSVRPFYAWLRFRSGERILATNVTYDSSQPAMSFVYHGRTASVPLIELLGLDPVSPRWQWLTVASPKRYEHHPQLAPHMTWQADATVVNTMVRNDNLPVLHGIGVPAGSTLQYDVLRGWRSLIVWPMFDDSAASDAACKASIAVDGRQVWQRTVKACSTQPAAIVGLYGKHDVSLQVEPVQQGDILDRFVWGWAVLAKSRSCCRRCGCACPCGLPRRHYRPLSPINRLPSARTTDPSPICHPPIPPLAFSITATIAAEPSPFLWRNRTIVAGIAGVDVCPR